MNGPRESGGHTALGQVLAAFAVRGGNLVGSRRRLDSPLTLTHIRWSGADGAEIEASRTVEGEALLSPEEREVWLQLALDCPVTPGPMTPEMAAAWVPLTTTPARASEFVRLLHTARPGAWGLSQPSAPASGMPNAGSYPAPSGIGSYPAAGDYTSGGFGAGFDSMGARSPMSQSRTGPPAGYPTSPPLYSAPVSGSTPLSALPPLDQDTLLIDTPTGWTNSWQVGSWQPAAEAPEVTVLVSIEIEMPNVLSGQSGVDYTQQFSRDVAASFKRVCRTLPQVRETRGWMRGNYLILAARILVGSGNRAPSSLEVESAAQSLADALARQTLPYNRLALANPGEWAQGVALPNA